MCSATKEIKKVMIDENISNSELALLCGWSSENLSGKMKRDNFKISDLEKVATALNRTLKISFV